MGRMLRFALTEDVPTRIDLAMVRAGKILISNIGPQPVRIAYETIGGTGDGAGLANAQNYYTLPVGTEYVFDCGPGVGLLTQGQQMFLACTGGVATVEVWIANE